MNTNLGALPYPIVMLDDVCRYRSGEPRISAESLQVEWMTPQRAVAAVTRPSMAVRLNHLLNFGSAVRNLSYRNDPFEVVADRLV